MSSYTDTFLHDPDAILDYRRPWSTFLATDETILTSAWTITGPDSALVEVSSANTTTDATIRLSGGTVGEEYLVTNRIVTSEGQSQDLTFRVQVRER